MAFPWLHESTFDSGAAGFTSETDTQAKLNIEHFTTLAGYPGRGFAPFRGSYAVHIDLSLGTAAAVLQEDTNFDLAATNTWAVRFFLYASGLVTATSDIFTIFTLQSAGPVSEVTFGIRNNSGVIELFAGETGATNTTALVQNKWHCIELTGTLDAGGGNDGTITFYVDGEQVGAQITALDQAAIVQAQFGAQGIDAGTTAGHLILDWIIFDDARIGPVHPVYERFPNDFIFTKTAQFFVGPGAITAAALLSTTAGNTFDFYDTDNATVTSAQNKIVELAVGANTSTSGPINFKRGCYVVLGGTNPRGQASIVTSSADTGGVFSGPLYYSANGYRAYAMNRKSHGASA